MKQYYLYTNDSIKGVSLTNHRLKYSLNEFIELADRIIDAENPEYISVFSISKKNFIVTHFEKYRDKNHKADLSYKNKHLK